MNKIRCIFDAQTKILTLNWLNLKVGLKEDLFKPRQKIIEVDLQRRNEEKLLDFIEKKFVIDMMKARQEHVSSKPKSFFINSCTRFFFKTKSDTNVLFISYFKCSNWRQISKRQTLDVYSLFATYYIWVNWIKPKLQTCNLQIGHSLSYKYVNQFWLNLVQFICITLKFLV